MKKLVNFRKHRKHRDFFSIVQEEQPRIIEILINDLLHVEGYSENEIGFALGMPLHLVKRIAAGDLSVVNRDVFLSIVSLYARVFCGWCAYNHN